MRHPLQTALILIAAAMLWAGVASAHPMGPGMMGWGMGGGWLGFLLMIVFWGVIIAAAVAFIRWLAVSGGSSKAGRGEPSRDSALEILRKRYARGEIDSEEFEQRKRALTED